MIVIFWVSCFSSNPVNKQETFAPSLVGIVQKMTWQYNSDCTGINAHWFTTLPKGADVQAMIGPKTQNPHFDDDAIVTHNTTVDDKGVVSLSTNNTHLPTQTVFVNLRVWGNTPSVYEMLTRSQKKGGFPVAQSPEGPYGWAETTIPPCSQ